MLLKHSNTNALVLIQYQLTLARRALQEVLPGDPFEGKLNFPNCKVLQFKEMYCLIKEANQKLQNHGADIVKAQLLLPYPCPEFNLPENDAWGTFVLTQENKPHVFKELVCALSINEFGDSKEKTRIVNWELSPDDNVLVWDEKIAQWERVNPQKNPWKKSPCDCILGRCDLWMKIQEAYFTKDYDKLDSLLKEIQ